MPKSSFLPNNFMLIPTAACQASCVYCFGPNRGETMGVGVADKALAFMVRIAPSDGSVHITFHGGEPLLVMLRAEDGQMYVQRADRDAEPVYCKLTIDRLLPKLQFVYDL